MFFGKEVKNRDILEFNKALSLLLYAKIGLVDAMEIILAQIKNEKFKSALKEITRSLKSGASISKSFGKQNTLFPEVFVATLRVAEETGEISSVMIEYTRYNDKIQKVKQKAKSATRYPVFIVGVASITLFFMIWFLIPNFEGIFLSFGKDIPALSKAVFNVSAWIRVNIVYILIGIVLLAILISKYAGSDKLRMFYSRIIPYIPIVSKLYKSNILARFSITMNTLLKNRVTLIDALKVAKTSSKDPSFIKEIETIQKSLVKGVNFAHILKSSKFFDVTFIKLLTAAEGASELDKAFMMTADYYTDEFDNMLETITSFMEPALILFIGVIVGTILIAMYLPMFELLNNFGF